MFKYLEEIAIIPKITCEKLAVVVTYNRKNFIEKWLRAWANAEHYGVKLAVIHTFDGERPDKDETENILQFKPTFYIPVYNTILRDYGPLVMVFRNLIPLPKWQEIFWFTDDMLPMRKTFLKPFVEKISKPDVGLVAQCYEPRTASSGGGHIRTVAYATKREVVDKLQLPDPSKYKDDSGYVFEHHENHILKQVNRLGYKFELCHSEPEAPNYQHWTSYLDWMWDCQLLGKWTEYWDVYEEQFDPIDKLEGCKGSNITIITQGESEKRSIKEKKTTIIVTTSFGSFNNFAICLLSIMANTKNNYDIENIVINISGPEKTNIESTLQDKKEELVDLMSCITIGESKKNIIPMRSWKPLTHGKMIEQALEHTNTENYLVVQDHVFLKNDSINDEIINFNLENSSIIKLWDEINNDLFTVNDGWITTPNTCASFALCKTSAMKEINASWDEYSIKMKFHIGNFISHKQFLKQNPKISDELRIQSKELFFGINMPPGTFVQDKLHNNNCKVSWFDKDIAEDMNNWNNKKFESEISKLCKTNEIYELIARFGLNIFNCNDRHISTRLS